MVNASAAEMARYVQFGVGDGAPLLSQKSLSEMHTGQIAAPDFNVTGLMATQARAVAEQPGGVPPALVTEQQYGFYWGVERFLGAKLVEHGVHVTGPTANATLLPERRSGVVVLATADGANTFMEVVRLHVAGLRFGRESPDVNATLQAQLEALGQDNASRRADLRAARTYRADKAELRALAATYESLADPEPTRVSVLGGRALRLESGFQSVRFSAELLPLGGDRSLANSEPLVGAVVRFAQGDEERTTKIETLLGAMPVAVRRVRQFCRSRSSSSRNHILFKETPVGNRGLPRGRSARVLEPL